MVIVHLITAPSVENDQPLSPLKSKNKREDNMSKSMPAPHRRGKSKAIEIGRSRSTETRSENYDLEKRITYWTNRLKDCDRTFIGCDELKSRVFVELINSIRSRADDSRVVMEITKRIPSTFALKLAHDKLGVKR